MRDETDGKLAAEISAAVNPRCDPRCSIDYSVFVVLLFESISFRARPPPECVPTPRRRFPSLKHRRLSPPPNRSTHPSVTNFLHDALSIMFFVVSSDYI
jgi:hypothetical protein